MTRSSVSPPPVSRAGEHDGVQALAARALRAALVVFLLDGAYVVIVFAGLLHRTTPLRIFQGIAQALLGPAAFSGGGRSAALGLLLHGLVALGWSVVWTLAYQRSAALRRAVASPARALVVGAAYGVLVWLGMQLVVLPLTRATPRPLLSRSALPVVLAHVLVVGPPIVLLVRRPNAPGAPHVR